MKKLLISVLSTTFLFWTGLNTVDAFLTKEHYNLGNKFSGVTYTSTQMKEKEEIIWHYYEFWVKNKQLILSKYIAPEYNGKIYYDITTFNKDNGISNGMNLEKYDKYTQLADTFDNIFVESSNYFYNNHLEYSTNGEKAYKNKEEMEKAFQKFLYYRLNSILGPYFYPEYILTGEKNDESTVYNGCNLNADKGVDLKVRGFVNYEEVKTSRGLECEVNYNNPDYDLLKKSYKDFFLGNYSMWKNNYVTVDSEFGQYLNFYGVKENLKEMEDYLFQFPSDVKRTPLKVKNGSFGKNVQERFPSQLELKNVIFNPHTKEVNKYILEIVDPYGELQYRNEKVPLILMKEEKEGYPKNNSFNYVNATKNTLSSVPHYFSNYNGDKTNILDSNNQNQDNTVVDTSKDPSKIYKEVTFNGKKYSVLVTEGQKHRDDFDELFFAFVNQVIDPYLAKTGKRADSYTDESVEFAREIKAIFDKKNYSNEKRNQIIGKLNDNGKLLGLVQAYNKKFLKNPKDKKAKKNLDLLIKLWVATNYQDLRK